MISTLFLAIMAASQPADAPIEIPEPPLVQSTVSENTEEADAKLAEKKICKTSVATGSRVAKRKICLTKADWDRAERETRAGLGREIRTGPNRANR